MFYRIRINLAFYEYSDMDDILDKALEKFPQAHTINPGQPNQERGFIIAEECHHDEEPPQPCQITEEHWTPVENGSP